MARVDEKTTQERMQRVLLMVQRSMNGVKEAEIAEETGIERRSVNNYLHDLETLGKVYKEGASWYAEESRPLRLKPMELAADEAAALYLAAKMLVRQSELRCEPLERGMLKLANALVGQLGLHEAIHAAARELAQEKDELGEEAIFKTILQGYLFRRWVRLGYQPSEGDPFETEFAPYLVEPGTYGCNPVLYGFCRAAGDLRAYQLVQVRAAELMPERFEMPEDFPAMRFLRGEA